MRPATQSLEARFVDHLHEGRWIQSEDRVIVGLSGGVDSTVLLHLLRFSSGLEGLNLVASHFDHRMRPDSADDLQWVRGLCRAWGVELRTKAADHPPTSEDEAREQRYSFLLHMMSEEKAALIATGHHADDQVETVLFRILRGTGLRGLAGIPASRSPGLVRPLLPFSRRDLLAYARENRVPYRTDPSNLDTKYSRNFLRPPRERRNAGCIFPCRPDKTTGTCPGNRPLLKHTMFDNLRSAPGHSIYRHTYRRKAASPPDKQEFCCRTSTSR